jgi:hypothetical protein
VSLQEEGDAKKRNRIPPAVDKLVWMEVFRMADALLCDAMRRKTGVSPLVCHFLPIMKVISSENATHVGGVILQNETSLPRSREIGRNARMKMWNTTVLSVLAIQPVVDCWKGGHKMLILLVIMVRTA